MIGEIGFNQVRGLVFYNVPIKGKHIRVIPDSLDFGIVGVGDSSDSRTVTISNIGSEDLTLDNISTHNSAFKITTDLLFPVIINPAGSETFEIIFSPVDSLSYSDTIHISSDDPDEPVKKILVTGKGMLIMPADSGMCYASTGATDGSRLLIIDPVTGQGTPIGPTGLFEVSSIAINSSGEIYGTYSGDLYRIDAATGKTLFHVSIDLYRIDALAFDSNNVLYAISSSSSLITINTVSGEFNQIGYISSLTGITFDPTNDSLWGISSSGRIYQISTETGSSTFIGSTGISGTTADLHFDIAGNLFAVTGGYYDTYKFISINKSTGKGIIIGEIGFRNVTGMAFYNVPIEGKHIRVIPDSIDFGIVEIGYSSDSRLITISNIGSENLTLDSISIPDESMNITGLPPFPAVIKPGTSLLLAVNFMPRDCDLEAASLVIFSDDNEGMARIITLVGKGISDNCPIVVNSTGDTDDINPGDGLCEDSNGNCTFRAAILEANNRPGKDTIKFNIPGLGPHTIQPDCGLPEITDSIVIEGTTEPDFTGIPIIELNGSNAGNEVSGLVITSGYSTIRGLVINRFNGNGIHIFEGGNNKIEGNYIGTDISGTIPLGNESGVFIENASNNTIGGLNSTSANIIACNRDKAIVIVSGTRNAILSNSIYNNAGGGIDLLDDGITVNDNVDIDIGPNNLQNFPEIISTGIIDNGNLVVKYAIDSDPVNSTYPLTIQFFRSDEERQGKVLLGTDTFTVGDLDSIMVTADLGNAEVLGMDEGEKISATATDGENNTSEFSEDQTIGRFVHIDPLESNVARIVNYPNPFTYRTTIQFPNSQRQNYTLIVTDLTGKRVRIINNITEDTFVFKREDLPGGLYLLELRGPKIFRGKIMIE
jgi:CSLREA domain-containing protein